MNLADLLPYVIPRAKGCPEVVATFNLRLAAIELCNRTSIWRDEMANHTGDGTSRFFGYVPNPDHQVVKLLNVFVGGREVPLVPPGDGFALDAAGSSRDYAYGRMGGFTLNPAPALNANIVTRCVLAPAADTESLPDSMWNYAEALAGGALSRILMSSGRDYSDPRLAVEFRNRWEDDIGTVKVEAHRGGAKAVTRTKPQWM